MHFDNSNMYSLAHYPFNSCIFRLKALRKFTSFICLPNLKKQRLNIKFPFLYKFIYLLLNIRKTAFYVSSYFCQ